jgi:hypothetical protein
MDNAKATQIVEASRASMGIEILLLLVAVYSDFLGMDISDIDLTSIQHFSSRVISLVEVYTHSYMFLVLNFLVSERPAFVPCREDAGHRAQPCRSDRRAGRRAPDRARRQLDQSGQVSRFHCANSWR